MRDGRDARWGCYEDEHFFPGERHSNAVPARDALRARCQRERPALLKCPLPSSVEPITGTSATSDADSEFRQMVVGTFEAFKDLQQDVFRGGQQLLHP
jgi:hypothetical protein